MNRKNKRCVTFLAVIALVVTSLLPVFVDAVEMTGVHDLNIAWDEPYEEFLTTDPVRSDYPFPDHYPSVQELYDWYDDLVLEYPDLVTKVNIGTSWAGRDLWVMEITSSEEQVEDKPEIVIDAAMHAREWSSVQVASYLMWRLLTEYETNETIYWLLNNRVVNIMPMQNPDGYIFDGNGTLGDNGRGNEWRKNRNESTPPGGVGVDLNRNWDINWAGGGSSGNPGSDVYHGEAPFSEYENKYLSEFMISRNVQSYQNIHSHHYSLLIPNMYTTAPSPHDTWYRGMASHMTSLTTLHGDPDSHYVYGQPGEVIGYSASGGAADWAYHALGAHGLVYELYTGGSGMAGFYPDPSLIMTINNDVDDSLIYQCRVADTDLGDGTVNLFPPIPYLVYGQAEDQLGNIVVGLSITIENTNTGESLSIDTDGNGYYELNFGNLVEDGYTLTDTFSISAGTFSDTFSIGSEWGHRRDIEITLEGDPPEISLTRPNGGEVFSAGIEETITWDTNQGNDPIHSINLWYRTDNDAQWRTIVSGIADTGSFTWAVPNVHSSQCMVRIRVRDNSGRIAEDVSDHVFTIEGIPPAPPSSLDVRHYDVMESVTNGIFQDDYDPWTLTRLEDDGDARWDSLYQMDGGSIYITAEATGEGSVSTEDSYWQQDISPTSQELSVGVTFRKNLVFGSGWGGWQTHINHAAVEILVHDTVSGWQSVLTDTSRDHLGDTDWIELQQTYEPQGDVDAVRARMHLEAVGDSSWADYTASGEIWIDRVSISREDPDGDQHNLITWGASLEDPDSVSHYNIYRSEFQSGPWDGSTLVDSIEADGSAVYYHLDMYKGMADDIFWWYVVRAVGINGLEEQNSHSVQEPGAQTETFDIQLYGGGAADGWNFVSFNIEVADTSLVSILSDIDGSYDRVMHYSASPDEWLTYVPGRPERYNTLQTWDHTMGMWVRVTEDITLSVEGYRPIYTDITLYPGWNMVGFPSGMAMNSIDTLPGEISRLGLFDATAEYNVAYFPKDQFHTISLHPGRGYWLYNGDEQSVVWRVEY